MSIVLIECVPITFYLKKIHPFLLIYRVNVEITIFLRKFSFSKSLEYFHKPKVSELSFPR